MSLSHSEEDCIAAPLLKRIRLFGSHLAVSLTNNCPLRCSHCIVSAVHAGTDTSERPRKLASRIGASLSNLKGRIKVLTFTGGEAPLAGDAFVSLGKHANSLGIHTALMTSAYWARNEKAATDFVRRHSFLNTVTISVDRHHIAHLPLSFSRNAVSALLAAGKSVSVRATLDTFDPASEDQLLLKELRSTFPCLIETQSTRMLGRAATLEGVTSRDEVPFSQCLSDGPHIDHEGVVLPCCSDLVAVSQPHCLVLGNVLQEQLEDIYERMLTNFLLSFIRLYGLDSAYASIGLASGCEHPCHKCSTLVQHPKNSAEFVSLVSHPASILAIAKSYSDIFGDDKLMAAAMERIRLSARAELERRASHIESPNAETSI